MHPNNGRPRFRALALAAGLSAFILAPGIPVASAAPVDDAVGAEVSLRTGPYTAKVTDVIGLSLSGVQGPLAELLNFGVRTTFVTAVESPSRSSTVFLGPGPYAGVNVVSYDGSYFASTKNRPLVRATGSLEKQLKLMEGREPLGIASATDLPAYVQGETSYRRLDVVIDRDKLNALLRAELDKQGLKNVKADVIRIDRARAEMYLRPDGPLALIKTRAAISIDLAALQPAGQATPELEGARLQMTIAEDVQITSLPGAVVIVAPPTGARTSDKLSTIGLVDPPPPRPAGPFGDQAGITLARKVNRVYRGVKAVRIDGGIYNEAILILRNGRIREMILSPRSEQGTGLIYATPEQTFLRRPGETCFTRFPGPSAAFPLNTPVITLNSSEFFRPRRAGRTVTLRLEEGQEGADALNTYTVDRATGRVLTSKHGGGELETWTSLAAVPPRPVTTPLCSEPEDEG